MSGFPCLKWQEARKEITGAAKQGLHQGPASPVFLLSGPVGRGPGIAVTGWRPLPASGPAACLLHGTLVSQHFPLKRNVYHMVKLQVYYRRRLSPRRLDSILNLFPTLPYRGASQRAGSLPAL